MVEEKQTRRDVVRNISAAAVGLAGVSGTVAATESSEDEVSVEPTDTKSFSIRFEIDSGDGAVSYRTTVPDETANLVSIEYNDPFQIDNDSVNRGGGETTVDGGLDGHNTPYYDEIQFDTDDGTRPDGNDWWEADATIRVTLDTPSGTEVLQQG
jgi:hypothetical protein